MPKLTHAIPLVMLLLLLAAMAGCESSGPQIASVSGRITMDGKPLANATVVFTPENGRPAGARTDENGNYSLHFTEGRRGAIPGPNTVQITTVRDPEQDENGKTVVPAAKETIPMEYNAASMLTFTVEPKKRNVANFDLKSGGKILLSE
ncbi:MAG TPA: carboxypeptidase-like regulatory domain-containing protein [Pirellulaceae bacterium]|jgi:hypothetical protein